MKRHIAILGSTGSIGTQTLDIIKANPEDFEVYAITAGRNADLLIRQALEFGPRYAVIADESQYSNVAEALSGRSTQVLAGAHAIEEVVTHEAVDLVITAMVGYSGLRPTLAAVRHGKTIGLANKETLVVAGELIMPLAQQFGARIIPVDSEHSAIYQCLIGEEERFERLILTASGGPFRTFSKEDLTHVSVAQALKHPNWTMGAKVTIDSASLMNKGFEMMEAKWLFDCDPSEIDVLVHPQSIIHSMVQFRDGVVKAQLGIPDMRLPISYALGLTRRIPNDYPRYDFLSQGFTFERPDTERFPNLALAYRAIELAGNAPCVLNAANEVAVAAFLDEQINFTDMSRLIEQMLCKRTHEKAIDMEILEQTDAEIRRLSWEWVRAHQR
ncbi:MAG: 1-deoxy-D-xylulose-5-phosphate reductoisomerase [Porphyromonadaceae bacterium]|nr:1-deoxy-D-xylulose-5-phosphate reductoisomerase [Porphyromonadaceae bacterium]